jgi:hypothetical protein
MVVRTAFDRPDVVLAVRILYAGSQLLVLGIYYYISILVRIQYGLFPRLPLSTDEMTWTFLDSDPAQERHHDAPLRRAQGAWDAGARSSCQHDPP